MLLQFLLLISLAWSQQGPLQFAVIGDAGKPGPEMDRLKSSLKTSQMMRLILPGDNLYKKTYTEVWDSWKRDGFQFPVVAIGNHHDGYENEVEYFGMPGEYYVREFQGLRFLVLNSDNEENVQEQFRWLEKEINRSQGKHLFLVFHHPPFTLTEEHVWTEKEEFQINMRKILKVYGQRITALLLGHDHISSFVQMGPTVAMVAGSGRSVDSVPPVKYSDQGFQVQTIYLAPETQHWGVLHFVSPNDKVKMGFVRVKDQKVVCALELGPAQVRVSRTCAQN